MFNNKTTYGYLVIAVVAVIIICLFIWFSDDCSGKQMCYESLQKPKLACNKCLNMFVFILLFVGFFFAGATSDWYAVQRGVSNGLYQSLRFLWLCILILIIVWVVLIHVAINLAGALTCAFFINIFVGASLYLSGQVAGAPAWCWSAVMLFTLILLAYTMCLYNNNKDNCCVRNAHFC